MRRPFVIWNNLKCEYGNASWAVVDDSIVTVRTAHGSKSAQVGGSNPEFIAFLLLRELASEQRLDT